MSKIYIDLKKNQINCQPEYIIYSFNDQIFDQRAQP